MAERHRYSTAVVGPEQRLVYWNEVAVNSIGPMTVDADRDGFHGELVRLIGERSEVVSAKSTGAVIRDGGPTRSGSDDQLFRLQLNHLGACRLVHNGRDEVIEAGDIVLMDLSKPFEMTFDQPLQALVLQLPHDRFAARSVDLEQLAGKPILAREGAAAVLSTFLSSTWDNLAEPDGGDWPDSALEVLWDLAERACKPQAKSSPCASLALRHRREARVLIEERLCDPDLDGSEVAEALGFGVRYLQLLFAEVGTTPSRFILARRLERAAARLRRLGKTCSITETALDVGFNDLSYFSRAFSRRFGVSPRDYRGSFTGCPAEWL